MITECQDKQDAVVDLEVDDDEWDDDEWDDDEEEETGDEEEKEEKEDDEGHQQEERMLCKTTQYNCHPTVQVLIKILKSTPSHTIQNNTKNKPEKIRKAKNRRKYTKYMRLL